MFMQHRVWLVICSWCVMISAAGLAAAATPHVGDSRPPANAPLQESEIYDEISPAQEKAMWAQIQANTQALRSSGVLAAPNLASTIPLGFPLRLAPGISDAGGFRVSAFVDHNPASGQVTDYNGGSRTYDGHRGTDYALSPFPWNKLDAGEVQVVAAAAGTIVAKANGDPTDHNCVTSSSDAWNYVALTHADGHMTIYGHMRYNSVTSKAIGQTVAQGELLGTAASSGNSSGPHLHFEVRYGGFSNAEWIDPYAGPSSQAQSLWASQRPYYDSAINKLATHSAPPSTPDPCQPTITNLQDHFAAPTNIFFYAYYRDFQGGLVTQFTIYRPDGSVFQSWQDVPANGAFSSSALRSNMIAFSPSDPAGTWRFAATYNGQTTQTFFTLGPPLVLNNKIYLPLTRH